MTNKDKNKQMDKKSKTIHICIIISTIVIIFAIAGMIMLKYQVEGEKKLPFELTKINIISTAEGFEKEGEDSKWNFDISQNNDVYITINKNDAYKNSEVIKTITLENFQTTKRPAKGEVKLYKLGSERFKNEEPYLVTESLQYQGSKTAEFKNLQISNQGGVITFRSCNEKLAQLQSEDEEIIHDGTLLTKTATTLESLKYTQSFDLIIETGNGIKYKANIFIDFPAEDILKEGIGKSEKTDFSDVVFKRM